MFDDFHETTRNVGVVGVFLGLLVVAGLGGLGMAVLSGTAESNEATIEGLVNDQAIHLRALESGLDERKSEIEKFESYRKTLGQIDTELMEITRNEEVVGRLKAQMTEVRGAVEVEVENFETYRSKYRLLERHAAEGEKIDLSATKGPDFKEMTISGVTPLHLKVMTSAGPLGIPYYELPLEVQDRFQFSADESRTYQENLRAAKVQRVGQMAAQDKRQEGKQANMALREFEREIAETENAARAKKNLADRYSADSDAWDRKATDYEHQAQKSASRGRRGMSGGQARKALASAAQAERNSLAAALESDRLFARAVEMRSMLHQKRREAAEAKK